MKIGTTLGAKYFLQFDEDNKLNKEPVPKVMSNFKKLLLGRLDTVIYQDRIKTHLPENLEPAG